ncbi:MAG TPA: hypothetical protein VEC92_00040 [Nitrososphaerales archaeon]|nr:hypothetical protein [Nitrososphaerales archaeon]
MNKPKVIAAVAALVLAVFWALVLLVIVYAIGILVLLVAPFFILVAIGIYGIIDGLGGGSGQARMGASRGGGKVGALGLTVLKLMAQGKSKDEIAASTAVSPMVIEEKLVALTSAGFLQGNALTEKGFDAVRESA